MMYNIIMVTVIVIVLFCMAGVILQVENIDTIAESRWRPVFCNLFHYWMALCCTLGNHSSVFHLEML